MMMANVITDLRILVSAALVFCPVFSTIFYVLYLIAGLADMVDGFIARKTNSGRAFHKDRKLSVAKVMVKGLRKEA